MNPLLHLPPNVHHLDQSATVKPSKRDHDEKWERDKATD